MIVGIVGQKWLARAVFDLCLERRDKIAAVCVPPGDKLADVARVVRAACVHALEEMPGGLDVLLCAHTHVYVTAEARARARYGALGYHPSLLPRHRGRDAVRWAIHMREPVTGGTLYWLDDGVDTGPIAAQDWVPIRPGDDAATLWRRDLAPLGIKLFARMLSELDRGQVPATPQDPELATWEPAFDRPGFASGAGAAPPCG